MGAPTAADAGSKEKRSRTANGADDANTAFASLRKEIQEMGAIDIEALGWTISAESPAKGPKAKHGGVKFLSPEGKSMSRAEVLKHLGLSGMTRDQCFKKAIQFKVDNPAPFTMGNIRVVSLGNIMVERGPKKPLFHKEDCIMPIGYKSVWKDPATGTEYTTEILDGMDALSTNSLACSVTWNNKKVVKESIEEAWQTVRQLLMTEGNESEKVAARSWDPSKLEDRVGLNHAESRKRIEGMRGAADCFMYRFLNERREPPGAAKASPAVSASSQCLCAFACAICWFSLLFACILANVACMLSCPHSLTVFLVQKGKGGGAFAKVQGKLSFEQVPAAAADGKKKGKSAAKVDGEVKPTKAKQSGPKAAAAPTSGDNPEEKQEGKTTGPKSKRLGKSALQIFSKEVREKVKEENPECAERPSEINKIINKMFKELPEDVRSSYEARSTRKIVRMAGDEEEGTGGGDEKMEDADPDATAAEDEGNEKSKEKDEEDLSLWHTTGNDYIGQRGRRYVYDHKNRVTDALHGTIEMWLPVEIADYFDADTGEPGALWKIVYDDPRSGKEDLDENEVQEAISLMKEEIPEKIKDKVKKREERLAEMRAKKEAAVQAKLAKQQAKLEQKEKKAKDKEENKFNKPENSADARNDVKEAPPDESTIILRSGPYKGKPASAVQIPSGTSTTFPQPALVDNFLPVFTFLRDLSGSLGFVRLSFEEVKECISSPSLENLQKFSDVAKWLTEMAVRSKWVRDEDGELGQEMDSDPMDIMDVTLTPGPMLNSKSKDSISYSCWQMVNESSWPEMARKLMQRSCVANVYKSLHDIMGEKEPEQLSVDEKLSLLRFLCDEACASDKVQRHINEKLRQIDRIHEKKRAEDAALRRREQNRKQQEKKGSEAAGDQAGENKEAEASASKPEDTQDLTLSKVPLTAVQVMQQLYALDPAPFAVKYKGQEFEGTLDPSSDSAAIKCNGQTFATPLAWVKHCQQKEKVLSIKTIIQYKGKNLKACEEEYGLKSTETSASASKIDLEMLIMEETLTNVDIEKRSREIKAALTKASKGLRHEPIGHDRWMRSYFCFDGVTSIVCACEQPSRVSSIKGNVGADGARDFGYDGEVPADYVSLNLNTDGKWTCYSIEDGTLKSLWEVLMSGPMGPRESALLEAMKEHGIAKALEEQAMAKVEPTEADAEEKDGLDKDNGFDWVELPKIGDVVWAKSEKGTWAPVRLVDPPGHTPPSELRDENSDEEVDEEFQTTGSVYIGKRVRLKVSGKRDEEGVIRWYLPLEKADFISEHTGKPAALWRVKFNDQELTTQDLEEFEVRAGLVEYAKAEAQRRGKNSDFLSSKSMFGQEIKWVYGQYFTDREPVDKFALQDLQPFAEFREIHMSEMRRANKSAILRQVSEANLYLEERHSSRDQEQDLKVSTCICVLVLHVCLLCV